MGSSRSDGLPIFFHLWNATGNKDPYDRRFRELPAEHRFGGTEVGTCCQHVIHDEDEFLWWRRHQIRIQSVSGLNILRSRANFCFMRGLYAVVLYDQLPKRPEEDQVL